MRSGLKVLVLCFAGVGHSALAEGVSLECKTKATAEETLACMSAVALSPWLLNESHSKLDDSRVVQATTRGRNVSYSGVGENAATLTFQCEEGRTAAYVATTRMMVGRTARVTYRVGNEVARSAQWRISDDREAVGLWEGKSAIPFIRALEDNSRLVVRIENRARLDAEFYVADVSRIVKAISAACEWP